MSFQYVPVTDETKALMQEFRDRFEKLSVDIDSKVSSSRGRSICQTKLEEAAFWLNKSITKNDA